MKKTSRILSALFAFIIMATFLPTHASAASSEDYYATYNNLSSDWSANSEMVDWASVDTRWTDYLTDTGTNSRTFSAIVEASYNSTVAYAKYNTELVNSIKNVPNEDLGYYVPQYTFSEMVGQVSRHINDGGNSPRWTCGDYCRFMVGLLRSQGIPAYIEFGSQGSTGRFHTRVAAVDTASGKIYYSDPTYGSSSGQENKWMWLTKSEYNYDYTQSYISSERMPTKRPSTDNSSGGTAPVVQRPNYPVAYAISIPADCRYDDVVVPITRNGALVGNIPMRVVWYDESWWFTARDVGMIMNGTTRSVNLSWDSKKDTLVFNRGAYKTNGSETNWQGEVLAIDKTSQAYMRPPAFFGSEQTNIRVISIGGTTFVRLGDIARMMNFDGTVVKETQSRASIKIK